MGWGESMAHGKRESEWLVIRRCLALIRRVQRGAATRGQLLAVGMRFGIERLS